MSSAGDAQPGLQLAYLTTRFPAISHTFIQREVDAMRARGAAIATISIRKSRPVDLLTSTDRAAQRTTYTVRPPKWKHVVGTHLRAIATGPVSYLRTLGFALRLPPGGTHGRVWQLFYFAEAVLIWWQMEQRGIRHIHAHFTTPPGNVAHLVTRFGNLRSRKERWSWSVTAHGTDIFNDGPGLLAAKIESASLVVAVSDFCRSQLMRRVEEEQWPKIRLVRCGLDAQWLDFNAVERAERADGQLRLLSVGRLELVKGHSILLDALAELRRRGVFLKTEIIGDGSKRDHLERRVGELGLEKDLNLRGAVGHDQLPRIYMEADIFCVPSLGEGGPVVAMEAMALGLPIVASNTGGIPELVEDGVTGVLVPPGRPRALADGIERLARDSDLRRRLGAAGRERIAKEFDGDRWTGELWRCLAAVARDGHRSRGCEPMAPEASVIKGESRHRRPPLVLRDE